MTFRCGLRTANSLTCCAATFVSVVAVLMRSMSSGATQEVPLCTRRTSQEYLCPYRSPSFCWAFSTPRSARVSADLRSWGVASIAWTSYPAIVSQSGSWLRLNKFFNSSPRSPCISASYTLLNFRRNTGDSLRATGELTCPAIVRASTKSKTAAGLQTTFWYTASRNSLRCVFVTKNNYQQVPLFVKVLLHFEL